MWFHKNAIENICIVLQILQGGWFKKKTETEVLLNDV